MGHGPWVRSVSSSCSSGTPDRRPCELRVPFGTVGRGHGLDVDGGCGTSTRHHRSGRVYGEKGSPEVDTSEDPVCVDVSDSVGTSTSSRPLTTNNGRVDEVASVTDSGSRDRVPGSL